MSGSKSKLNKTKYIITFYNKQGPSRLGLESIYHSVRRQASSGPRGLYLHYSKQVQCTVATIEFAAGPRGKSGKRVCTSNWLIGNIFLLTARPARNASKSPFILHKWHMRAYCAADKKCKQKSLHLILLERYHNLNILQSYFLLYIIHTLWCIIIVNTYAVCT